MKLRDLYVCCNQVDGYEDVFIRHENAWKCLDIFPRPRVMMERQVAFFEVVNNQLYVWLELDMEVEA